MHCKISNWACVYHACMSNDCQKAIVIENMPEIEKDWGKGSCEEKKEIVNNQINKQWKK